MEGYDHKKIEKKWREEWARSKLYETKDESFGPSSAKATEGKEKENFYLLTEFPYPSGNLHVGHWYAFALPDILARYQRMRGKNVLFPIGFDAFGLPAENAAIKNRLNPRVWTEGNIAHMRAQIESMGTSYDWSREVQTIDPSYYKWTQWQFLQLFKKGLVYQKETAVNWCPNDKTVLANEQVVEGKCERCDSIVEQKMMLQWNIKITEYADRLIDDLAPLDWPEEIKQSQRNWIGRSEGAEIDFLLDIEDKKHVVFLHGKGGSPDNDFFRWARSELEKGGYTVEIPALPNSSEPDDIEQSEFILKNCRIDENTILVGHSAGGLAAMRLLEKTKAGRLVLIATPYSPVFMDGKERPTVSRSITRGYDFGEIKKNVKGILALYDEGDHIIPLSDGENFAKKLDGLFIKGRGTVSHFNGDKEPDVLLAIRPTIRVFTTRPDTLFGATYLVLSPEHPLLRQGFGGQAWVNLQNKEEIVRYIALSGKKTELERLANQKEKTGVRLEGVDAINPATGEKIPLFVADYVLATYGTGAIMAVPAHDERDFEFAKKFNIPVKEVVEPLVVRNSGADAFRVDEFVKERTAIFAVVKHWSEDKYLCLQWKGNDVKGFVTGGVETGEDVVAACIREIAEETGYTTPVFVRQLGGVVHAKFYNTNKKENRFAHYVPLLLHLKENSRGKISEREVALHDAIWIDRDKVREFINRSDFQIIWDRVQNNSPYTEEGILTNSNIFDGMTSEEAKSKITEAFGRKKTTYKLRDWIVSRQRYWGVPIPIIHCEKCGSQPVPDNQLPVLLPEVEDYLPEGSGKSPLAKVDSFVNASCPKCGGGGKRETDTLDTFVDSSWYFLRYTDPNNDKEFASASKMKHWMPVNLYSGGAEHTTMHLLYSRFWHKALFDLGLVADPEPYTRRMNRSLILGPDGQKMSKSRGNVVDPDEVVERLGADTVRLYLAFIGPYNEVSSYPWNPDGVVGVRRFLERVFRIQNFVQDGEVVEINTILHKSIQKVGEDIQVLKFNTAISQCMILLNHIEKAKKIGRQQFDSVIKLLAPFAPFVAEELWNRVGHTTPLLDESWPSFEESQLREDTITIAIQVNGKTRGEVSVPTDSDKITIEEAARTAMSSRIANKKVLKTIVVPGRLVNFVLETDGD